MADSKISALTALTALASDDELVVVDKSDTSMAASGTTKRVAYGVLNAALHAHVVRLRSSNWSALATGWQKAPSHSRIYGDTVGQGVVWPVTFTVDGTLDQLALEVTQAAASGAVRLALFANSGEDPGSLLVDAGQVDASTTGVKTLTISQAVKSGVIYWVAVTLQGAATVWVRQVEPVLEVPHSSNGSLTVYTPVAYTFTGVTGAYSSTLPTLSAASGAETGFGWLPRVLARA